MNCAPMGEGGLFFKPRRGAVGVWGVWEARGVPRSACGVPCGLKLVKVAIPFKQVI